MRSSDEHVSLRERKAAITRKQILDAAGGLFARQGYDETRLEQIAQEAVVSVPTLLAYFESKERLALHPMHDNLEAFRDRVEDPDRADDTLTLWHSEITDRTAKALQSRRRFLARVRFASSSPALLRANLLVLSEYVRVLGAGLAKDFGTDFDSDIATRLLATMLVWGHDQVVTHWVSQGGSEDLTAAAVAVVDFAREHFPDPGRRFPAPTPRRRTG